MTGGPMPLATTEPDQSGSGHISSGAWSLRPILQQVALAANSPLALDEVLERLARLTLEAVPGDRCAIFLLDSAGRLVPRMAVGRVPNDEEWQRFRVSEPIELMHESDRWDAFSAGHALYFADLASTPLVPQEFVEIFGAHSALLMPLIVRGEALGLLTVDWSAPDYRCTQGEPLVEAIGAYVALAIRNGRLYERLALKNRTLERLVELASALNSAASLTSVLELTCSAFEELLGATMCSINLFDLLHPGSIRTLAARGNISTDHERPGRGSKESAPKVARGIEHIRALWMRSSDPLVYEDLKQTPLPKHLGALPRLGSAVLFPLMRPDGPHGYVLAAFPEHGMPTAEHLETGKTLTDLAATATARAHLHQELQWRLQRIEILYRLSDVASGAAKLAPTLRTLNELLPKEFGIKLESIILINPRLRDAFGASVPSMEDLSAIRSWRSTIARGCTPPLPRATSDGLLVPITHRKSVLGALKVSVDPRSPEQADDDLLLALSSTCAEVVYKAGLRRELAESDRRLAIAAERERIARDLHDSVGQLLTGLGMRLADFAEDACDPIWRERLEGLRDLAARGSREVRDVIQSLLFLQVRRHGLERSLRELARTFEATTGVRANFRVSGEVVSLATAAEGALFRVAHEALMNAERHSRASVVVVMLTYAGDGVTVAVTDDGVGLGDTDPLSHAKGHFGLRGSRCLLEDAGGELELCDLMPHGLRVQGRIPIRGRAKIGGL